MVAWASGLISPAVKQCKVQGKEGSVWTILETIQMHKIGSLLLVWFHVFHSSNLLRNNLPADTSSVPSKPTKTRWDEIRIANAQSASQSSWELIRQKNGRASMQNNKAAGSRKQPEESLENADAERKAEQAGFDAMLEAERKAGQNV